MRWTYANNFLGRRLVFVVVAGLLSSIEHYLLLVVHPTAVTEPAMMQLAPRLAESDSLRAYEAFKNWAMTVNLCAVLLIGA